MNIDSSNIGQRFIETEFSDADIMAALNLIQKAYDEHMEPAWAEHREKGETDETARELVRRGISFAVASGAYHKFLTSDGPAHLAEHLAALVSDVAAQMNEQVKARKESAAAEKRKPSA